MSVEDKFRAAVKVIQSLPADGPYQPSNSTKLKFYGLYKQATEGQCKQGRPAFWDVVGRAKWDAWNKLGDLEKDKAMNHYIDELKKIVETMSFNGDVQDFLDSIGPFYEFINLNSPDLDNIKETIERLTSSDSSCTSSISETLSQTNSLPSSPDSTAQSTPAKGIDVQVEEVEKTQTNNNQNYSNGHIPNKEVQQLLGVSNQMVAPDTPVHKPLANGHAKRYSIADVDNMEKQDEVMEVPAQPARIVTRSNSNSSESDRYYSGDSDIEMDQTVIPNEEPTSSSKGAELGSELRRIRGLGRKSRNDDDLVDKTVRLVKSQVVISERQAESVKVLQGTVDRLNRDMEHVLARLRILEAAYVANPGGAAEASSSTSIRAPNGRSKLRASFRELSRTTWVIIFTWPVAVHLLLKLISWWLDRRRRARSKPFAIMP